MPKYLDEPGLSHFWGNIKGKSVQAFATVADMQGAADLADGMIAHTNGFHTAGDGGAAYYTIGASDTANGMDVLALQNGLYATLVVTEPYVTPEMFGAYGDGTHDDHDAILAAFKYVTSKQVAIDANNYSTIAVQFNTKKYLNGSTVTFGSDTTLANVIQVDGNDGWVTGFGFKFESNAGWKANFKNLNFADMATAFDYDERNLEYGHYVFDHLRFRRVTKPFVMNRRSCIVDIMSCYFMEVQAIGEFTNVDRLYFHKNWVEPSSSLVKDLDYHSMLKQVSAAEGAMFVYNNLFVPVGGSNCTELCWIEVNEHARVYNNRFGGENTNYHPLRVGAGFLPKGSSGSSMWTSKHPYISFDHNDEVSGFTPIILESVAGNMLFTDNQGWRSGDKVLVWSGKVTEQQQEALVLAQARMLNLVIRDNVGRTFLRDGSGTGSPAAYLPSIPTNLYGVLNRGLHALGSGEGENAAWLAYVANDVGTSVDLVVHDQPFGGITSASLGGRFRYRSSFAILFWCGHGYSSNYGCATSYGLITFGLSGTTITPSITWLGPTLPIDVTINGGASVDATTIANDENITVTLTATTKAIKQLKAQVFRPHNQLGAFV